MITASRTAAGWIITLVDGNDAACPGCADCARNLVLACGVPPQIACRWLTQRVGVGWTAIGPEVRN